MQRTEHKAYFWALCTHILKLIYMAKLTVLDQVWSSLVLRTVLLLLPAMHRWTSLCVVLVTNYCVTNHPKPSGLKQKTTNSYALPIFVGQEAGCSLSASHTWSPLRACDQAVAGLQAARSPAGEEAASKLTKRLATGLKTSTSNRAHASFSTRVPNNTIAGSPKASNRERMRARQESKTAPKTEAMIFPKANFASASPGSREGNYISAGHHWKTSTVYYLIFILLKLWMRPLRLRDVMTCPSGRARIQIQVCMTLSYSLHHNSTVPSQIRTSGVAGGFGTVSVLL